jgi:hypothetical protein
MNRRSNRRRARNAHNSRNDVVHLCDRIRIDSAACREVLRDEKLDDMARLMLLVAVAHGDVTLTFGELKVEIAAQVLNAGGVQAAIRQPIVLR